MFSLGSRKLAEPVTPPAERPEQVLLSRIGEVDRLTAVLLLAQSDLYAGDRDGQLVDALLDIRRALCLSAPGLRAVPVIPGPGGEGRG